MPNRKWKMRQPSRFLPAAYFTTELLQNARQAHQIAARKKVTIGDRTQWYFTKTIRIPEVSHAVRVLILSAHWNSTNPTKILITNQTHWEVTRVLRGYGQHWTGTETGALRRQAVFVV